MEPPLPSRSLLLAGTHLYLSTRAATRDRSENWHPELWLDLAYNKHVQVSCKTWTQKLVTLPPPKLFKDFKLQNHIQGYKIQGKRKSQTSQILELYTVP